MPTPRAPSEEEIKQAVKLTVSANSTSVSECSIIFDARLSVTHQCGRKESAPSLGINLLALALVIKRENKKNPALTCFIIQLYNAFVSIIMTTVYLLPVGFLTFVAHLRCYFLKLFIPEVVEQLESYVHFYSTNLILMTEAYSK